MANSPFNEIANFIPNKGAFAIPDLPQTQPMVAPSLIQENPELAKMITGGRLPPELFQQPPQQQQMQIDPRLLAAAFGVGQTPFMAKGQQQSPLNSILFQAARMNSNAGP